MNIKKTIKDQINNLKITNHVYYLVPQDSLLIVTKLFDDKMSFITSARWAEDNDLWSKQSVEGDVNFNQHKDYVFIGEL